MPEGKKSFLLYTDLIHTVKKLDDEKAGQLLKHILAYVNDENPETDDYVLDLVFEPIKQSLKRDLKKYEAYIEKQRLNGMKGGRPKTKKPNPLSGKGSQAKKPKKPDSVSDSVSDSESNKKPTEQEFLSYCKTLEIYSSNLDYSIKAKYQDWKDSNWKDGHGNKIDNWKNKIRNTLPYLKPVKASKQKWTNF